MLTYAHVYWRMQVHRLQLETPPLRSNLLGGGGGGQVGYLGATSGCDVWGRWGESGLVVSTFFFLCGADCGAAVLLCE